MQGHIIDTLFARGVSCVLGLTQAFSKSIIVSVFMGACTLGSHLLEIIFVFLLSVVTDA